MRTIRQKAYAKVNLFLDIVGMDGGYHMIDTVFTTISLYDEIILTRRNVPDEEQRVRAFTDANHFDILADIPRSDDITRAEDLGKTVVEYNPALPVSQKFLQLAKDLLCEID